MKLFKSNVLLLLLVITATSCQKESVQNELDPNTIVDYKLVEDGAKAAYQELIDEKGAGFVQQYWCSEQTGTYESELYVNHGIYLSPSDVPSPSPFKYATWMTNLEEWLSHDFNDINASGSNSTEINISFDVLGAGGGTYLNAANGNRAYNEFVCHLMYELSASSVDDLDNYEFSLNILVGYLACCVGSTCCNPVLIASGAAYY